MKQMVDVKWICLSVSSCRGQFSSVGEVRDQSLQSVGAADVLQISFGAFVLVSFDEFFLFFSSCDSPYRNETDEPSSSKGAE